MTWSSEFASGISNIHKRQHYEQVVILNLVWKVIKHRRVIVKVTMIYHIVHHYINIPNICLIRKINGQVKMKMCDF